MTDVRPLLDEIDRVLAECDASTLRAIDLTSWQRDLLVRMYEPPIEPLGRGSAADQVLVDEPIPEPKPEPMRGWLRRWIDRITG